jgi:regulatory protein
MSLGFIHASKGLVSPGAVRDAFKPGTGTWNLEHSLSAYLDSLGSEAGTITKVSVQSRRRDRVSVFVDGAFAFGVSDEVAVRHGLGSGVTVGRELLEAVRHDEAVASCKRVALHFISYRMRSEAEVRRRLKKEDAGHDVIDSVVANLREIGLIDDAAFADAFARDAVQVKKWGPHRIARGLRQAGLGDEHVEHALAQLRHVIEDGDLVRKVAGKRWDQLSGVSDLKKRKKRVYDYLARRGFDFEDIRRVLDDL